MTEAVSLNKLRALPNSRNSAAILHRGDIIRCVVEHQCRDVDLWYERRIHNGIQNILAKVLTDRSIQTVHDLIW